MKQAFSSRKGRVVGYIYISPSSGYNVGGSCVSQLDFESHVRCTFTTELGGTEVRRNFHDVSTEKSKILPFLISAIYSQLKI